MSSEGETVSRGIHSRVFGTNSAFSVGLRTAGGGGGGGVFRVIFVSAGKIFISGGELSAGQ